MAQTVYGIDLGTTYSCIAKVDEFGKPSVITNLNNKPTTPSVVYFETPENIVVGEDAKDSAQVHPDQVVECVKRSMGDANYRFECHGKSYRPEEISAYILKKLAQDAKQKTGDDVQQVVITCPAYFSLNQREATKQAGEIAGFDVKYVIPEPMAAALAYGMDGGADGTVLVYDLGGGTFDVTVMEIKASRYRTIWVDGDSRLGGKDWDDRIIEYVLTEVANTTGMSADEFRSDKEAFQTLSSAAEAAKIQLTNRVATSISVFPQGKRTTVELTREKFNELTADLLQRTMELTKSTVEQAAEKGHRKIDRVLLVGGSSLMPQVMERLKQQFQCEIGLRDPHEIVAKGAALFAFKVGLQTELEEIIKEFQQSAGEKVDAENADPKTKEKARQELALRNPSLPGPTVVDMVSVSITNISAKSFGLVVMNKDHREVVTNLVIVGDEVPAAVTREFPTYQDGDSVDLRVMENGNRADHSSEVELVDCDDVCRTNVKFQRVLPKNSPIQVTYKLSEDGLLFVHGLDLTTNQEAKVSKETGAIMRREEVEAAKKAVSLVAIA